MNFAQSILEKYGWSEGQGLGKSNDGIVKPIKATYKFDNGGLGHDAAASDFNNHWWERVYNDAASNVKVSTAGDKPIIQTNEEDAVDISTSSINFKKMKKKHGKLAGFGTFIKTATLTNTGRESANMDQVNIDEFRHETVKSLTDEELFAACGGRTAHKGARHGLKLSGKLARMAEQDAKLMERIGQASSPTKPLANTDDCNELNDILYQCEYNTKLSKRKKKKQNRVDNDLSESLDTFSLQSTGRDSSEEKLHRIADGGVLKDGAKKTKKSKKLKKVLSSAVSSLVPQLITSDCCEADVIQKEVKKKRKSKKSIKVESEDEQDTDVTELEDSIVCENTKKSTFTIAMKPKRKRNKEQKAEKKLAKTLAASLSVS